MSVESSEEVPVGLKLEKVRGYRSVKSKASEEAHALSSTQKRKGEQRARKNHEQGARKHHVRGSRLYFIVLYIPRKLRT